MTPQQIIETIDYLHDIERQLDFEYNLDELQLNLHMSGLTRLIQRLMINTYSTKNQDLKVKLALLEKKARELLAIVRERLGVYN